MPAQTRRQSSRSAFARSRGAGRIAQDRSTLWLALGVAAALVALPLAFAEAAAPSSSAQPRAATKVEATADGFAVNAETIADELTRELAASGLAGRTLAPRPHNGQPVTGPLGPAVARVELDNPGARLVVTGAARGIAIEDLAFDQRSSRVTATVVSIDGPERMKVSGRLRHFVDLPVLNRPIMPGEVITSADVDLLPMRTDRLAQTVIAEAGDLVGKTPRRTIRPQEPVRVADVQSPVVIKKGDIVTIVLATPTMRLTAQGKAQDDGGKGQTIRVVNTKSSRTIEALVVGPGTVSVAAPAASY